jgi:hypothetical protein
MVAEYPVTNLCFQDLYEVTNSKQSENIRLDLTNAYIFVHLNSYAV